MGVGELLATLLLLIISAEIALLSVITNECLRLKPLFWCVWSLFAPPLPMQQECLRRRIISDEHVFPNAHTDASSRRVALDAYVRSFLSL